MTEVRKVIEHPLIAPWLAWAIGELGVKELPGAADNPRIREYHAATKGGPAPDAVYWCASFVNWCLRQAGLVGTQTKAAIDFTTSDRFEQLSEPRIGCIAILKREDEANANARHATLWLGKAGPRWFIGLGGNQQNEVGCNEYANSRVEAYLWPKAYLRPA